MLRRRGCLMTQSCNTVTADHQGTCATLHPSRPPHTLGVAILGRTTRRTNMGPHDTHNSTVDLEIACLPRIHQPMYSGCHTEQRMSSATLATAAMRLHVRENLETSIWHYNTSSSSRLFEGTKDLTKEHSWKRRCISGKHDACKEITLPLLDMATIYIMGEASQGLLSAICSAATFSPS